MSLQGCVAAVERGAPEVIAVPVRDAPPADLLTCPEAAEPFPTDAQATMPAAVRGPLAGLAIGYRDLFNRTERLINWIAPGTCPAGAPRP
jgi:hypothetical protein